MASFLYKIEYGWYERVLKCALTLLNAFYAIYFVWLIFAKSRIQRKTAREREKKPNSIKLLLQSLLHDLLYIYNSPSVYNWYQNFAFTGNDFQEDIADMIKIQYKDQFWIVYAMPSRIIGIVSEVL